MASDSWTTGLLQKGLCYEGIVNDVDTVFEKFQQQTTTSWGTRTSTTAEKETVVSSIRVVNTRLNYKYYLGLQVVLVKK